MVSTLWKVSSECLFEINISLKNLDVLYKHFFRLKHITRHGSTSAKSMLGKAFIVGLKVSARTTFCWTPAWPQWALCGLLVSNSLCQSSLWGSQLKPGQIWFSPLMSLHYNKHNISQRSSQGEIIVEVNTDISFAMALKSTVANRTRWTFFLPSLFNKLWIVVVMLFMSCLHLENS